MKKKPSPFSRFPIHDEETAPEGSLPVLKGALSAAGQLPNFLGVLSGSPAALRGYAKARSELRHGALRSATLERIAIAVAELHNSAPGRELHARTARQAGLGVDEIAAAKRWRSSDVREQALLSYLRAVAEERGNVPQHLHEEALEAGWSERDLLEGIAFLSLEAFTALINVAGNVPVDGSSEETRQLRAVA